MPRSPILCRMPQKSAVPTLLPFQPDQVFFCSISRPDISKGTLVLVDPSLGHLVPWSLLLGHLFPFTACLPSFLPAGNLGVVEELGWPLLWPWGIECEAFGVSICPQCSMLPAPSGTLPLQLEGLWLSRDGWKWWRRWEELRPAQ